MHKTVAQHCIKTISIIVLLALMTVSLFNILVDPYSIFNVIKRNERPIDLVDLSYLTKAVGLIKNKADTLIIGSSIVDAGFKLPGSMTAYHDVDFVKKMQQLKTRMASNTNIYNAGIRGGGLQDIANYIHHAVKNNPNINHIIIGVEWNLFTFVRNIDQTVPYTAPLGKNYVPWHFYVNNILSWHVTYDSLRTFYAILRKHFFKLHAVKNFHKLHYVKHHRAQIENFFNWCQKIETNFLQFLQLFNLEKAQQFNAVPVKYNDITQHLIQGQNSHELASLLFSIWSGSALKNILQKEGANALLNTKALTCMRQIVQFANAHHIKLDIYVSPQHGAFWQTVNQYGLQIYVDEWLRQLAKITPYWDFSNAIDFSDNVDNYFDTDALHFNANAGELILPSILQGHKKLASNIRYVTIKNIDATINERHQAEKKWLAHNHYLKAIFTHANFLKTENIAGELNRITIMEYQPSFEGYYIIQFMDKYIALPTKHTTYDFRLFFTEKYSEALTEKSLAALLNKIKHQKA